MRAASMLVVVGVCAAAVGCGQSPGITIDEVPCGPCGTCSPGSHCIGGVCVSGANPSACDPSDPQFAGWPSDSDLEPNGHPDCAIVLPCGDDGVFTNPVDYVARCPSRENYTNGFMNLVTCPAGDRDFYAVYLLPEETVTFEVLYAYNDVLPRDLDARIWRWDFSTDDWNDSIAVGASTTDGEELSVSTVTGSNNPQGWYYLEVYGKTAEDANFYTVRFTLNPAAW